MLLALAPYFNPAYEKIYAYANDDITKRWPTVGLSLEILADDHETALGLRPLFYADAALSRNRLTPAET